MLRSCSREVCTRSAILVKTCGILVKYSYLTSIKDVLRKRFLVPARLRQEHLEIDHLEIDHLSHPAKSVILIIAV